MTSFDRREEAFEAKFAHDQELAFKKPAPALGLWAAAKRGETGTAAEDYARGLIDADISGVPNAALANLSAISLDMALTPRKFVKSSTNSSLSCNAPWPDTAPGRR